MIDAPATLNRAMEWQAWREKVTGELYYDTTYAFSRGDAWTNQYYFSGNGDGTLFYPGTPAKIGGTTQIPIASLRLKMIREGQEDYEYLKMLADSGDATMADTEAAGLSPNAFNDMSDPALVDAARHRIAVRIEQLTAQTPPPMTTTGGGGGGSTGTGGGTGTGSGDGSGGSTGTGGGTGTTGTGTGVGGNGGTGTSSTPADPSSAGTEGAKAGTSSGGCSTVGGTATAGPAMFLFALALGALVTRRRAPALVLAVSRRARR